MAIGLVARSLPPPAMRIPEAPGWPHGPVVAGAFHVHTVRSDGRGSIDEVAAAAARAGLQFVVFTDHGDGTIAPEPPAYRSSVLCIDGVEVSTSGGHYAVVGMAKTPYPIGGEPRDVVEDVRRFGGFGVVAHGESPKADLAWTDWSAPVDGLEWLNLDNVWRQAPAGALVGALLGYWIRAPQALAGLTLRSETALARWDVLGRAGHVVALAATDAHAAVIPSYDALFRTISTRVELAAPLTGDAPSDARSVVEALRAGHHYSVIDAIASPTAFAFTAHASNVSVSEGDSLRPWRGAILDARVAAPAGSQLVLRRNGEAWRTTRADHLEQAVDDEPAVYRVEVQVPGAPGQPRVPWIVSNPIFVGGAPTARADVVHDRSVPTFRMLVDQPGAAWEIERDPASTGTVAWRPDEKTLEFRYALGPGRPRAQFVALVRPVRHELLANDRLILRATSDHPVRLTVQLRASGAHNPPRWVRSFYLDEAPRAIEMPWSDFRPLRGLNADASGELPRGAIDALMFVVDTNHSNPGAAGTIRFSDLAYER